MHILTEMSKMKNKKIETKSFSEIWLGLNVNERSELCRRLLLARCCTTYQTVWNWGNGKASPSSPLIRDKVAATVSKFIDKKTSHQILFPIQ